MRASNNYRLWCVAATSGLARAFCLRHFSRPHIQTRSSALVFGCGDFMAMSRFKKPPPLVKFVRELTVHRDGIAWMDINDRLKLGIQSCYNDILFQGWLNAGLPVVLA